jgi:hypothetical protein
MKVERKVDTVCIEMDIDVAEQLLEILNQVSDETRMGLLGYYDNTIKNLRAKLITNAEVRTPSALHIAVCEPGGYVTLRSTTNDEFDARRGAYLERKNS